MTPIYRVRSAMSMDWEAADCLRDFSLPWDAMPAPGTEFRALWSPTHLHFRFDCIDPDIVLGQGETLLDQVLDSDRVELFFAPDLSLKPYYCFEIDPRGQNAAYKAVHYRQMERNFTGHDMVVSPTLMADGYSVAGSISLDCLRRLGVLKPEASTMHVGVYRAEFSRLPDGSLHRGWMPWVNPQTAKPDFHVPESFGCFELV
jgi:Carbohydrate family 9 binding domain-like